MTSPSLFFSFRKSVFVLLPILLLGAYAVHDAISEPGGITGCSKIGCSSCHGPGSTTTVVTLSTTATQIEAGKTYVFQFSVANPSESEAGCDISVDNGAVLGLDGANSGLWIPSGSNELTHTQPQVFTGDSAVWSFTYTAPLTPGTAHIYAAGNAVDFDGGLSNVTTYDVTVSPAAGPDISAPALVRDTALRGDTSQINFWVKNTGTAELNISNYSMRTGASFFVPDPSPITIAPGDSAKLTVNMVPAVKGIISDTCHIYSNDSNNLVTSVAFVGFGTTGVYHVSAQPLKFAPVAVAASDTVNVTISNTGNGPLAFKATSLKLSNPDFSLVSLKPADTSFELAPKATVIATFAFSPTRIGADTGFFPLSVSQYGGNVIDTSIELIGTGTQTAGVGPVQTTPACFTVSPNPTRGIIDIASQATSGLAEVEVSDPAGRILLRNEIDLGNENSLNLSSLPSGIYFLAMKQRNGPTSIAKIILQR